MGENSHSASHQMGYHATIHQRREKAHSCVKKYRSEVSGPSIGFVGTTLIEGSEAIRLHLPGGTWVELKSVHVLAQLIRAMEEIR